MIVKTPDYIIADCGCPLLGKKHSGTLEDFATLSPTACIIRDTNKRLLPLRETLMDAYARQLVNKLKAWEITKTNAKLKEIQRHSKCEEEPANAKQLKTQCNETIKQQQQHQQQQQKAENKNVNSSKQNILDKSRHSSRMSTARTTPTTPTTITTKRTRRPTLDTDLDVF